MAKKLKRSLSEKQMAEKIGESANQIWLAGLAAFEKAQKEGGKIFDKLVREGEQVESRTRKFAGESLEEVKSKATGTWDKLEQVFEERVERALQALGVPTNHDVAGLSKQVDALSAAVSRLTEGRKSAAGTTSPKPKSAAATTRKAKPAKSATKPSSRKSATAGPDDLKVIAGIGPALERQLNEFGVSSYQQMIDLNADDIAKIEASNPRLLGRVAGENWIAQAKVALQEKYGK